MMTMITHLTPRRAAAVLALSVLAMGCAPSNDAADAATPGDLPADHPPLTAPAPQAAGAMTGVVLEKMDGGGYTYARVSTESGEIWTAGPMTALEQGDTVALVDPFPMQNFRSNTLDRTFDVLYFVGGYQSGAVAPPPPAAIGGVVLQVLNSGGYTYMEVETDGAPTWLAASGMEVAEGDRVAWGEANLMRNFTSGTLNRTFDEILFVGYVQIVE